ncbi:LuxR C-terminal-related transcriptional regulator [Dechloromonas sp. ARDL1]|uniref:helix-turn-helix transcriptional regulator n=1 Tax=Dechloromonas sp. ARDL1 TaxID=3322121 RepID=UPI003DA795EB
MNHCFVDRDALPLPAWLAAFPQARVMRREQLSLLPSGEPVVLWVRLRSGESLASVMPPALEAWQLLVLLADEPDDEIVADALSRSASGCCNTHAAPEVLRQVALVVGNGGLWVGQSLLRRLVGGTSRALATRSERPPRVDWSTVLSEREVQVARLVAGGASNREVAEQLSITERTVKAHMSAIFEKLGLRDRLQLSLRINGVQV